MRDSTGAGDAEFWEQQWDRYEEDKAIVDVDVRGWIYTPHTGPLTRRNRLFIGLARQMVGIPGPSSSPSASTNNSRSSSPKGMRQRMAAYNARDEEEIVAKEAETLLRKGEAEAAAAGKGAYSEKPSDDQVKSESVSRERSPHVWDDSRIKPLQKRESWNAPANMSPEELSVANRHLMSRLKPFLAIPLATTPVSAFFYNEHNSRQKTIDTDAYGHFALRAALDFVPTHVRVLAAEGLSATEEIKITEPRGVSVISDVDDTIKHSAIGSGAREIFRNVFIRELGDLRIDGVNDLYQRLSEKGVQFHYVSNSPWQLYPVLSGFFAKAGLPAGSFHLKQYSGMFQGIFEPVAERKKGTLEKLLRDFPDRRFILIGDSGEADLEVYTDLVCENPGRILGVFIRDVTTAPEKKGFFDSSMSTSSSSSNKPSTGPTRSMKRTAANDTHAYTGDKSVDDPDMKAAIAASLQSYKDTQGEDVSSRRSSSANGDRPPLPPRRKTGPIPHEEDLINLDSDEDLPEPMPEHKPDSKAPVRPPKPRKLSSTSTLESAKDSIPRKPAPPIPPKKPSMSSTTESPVEPPKQQTKAQSDIAQSKRHNPPPPPPSRVSYRLAAKERLNAAYEYMPTIRSTTPSDARVQGLTQSRKLPVPQNGMQETGPPLPTRPAASTSTSTSYAASAKAYASNLYNSATAASSTESLPLPASNSSVNAASVTDSAYQTATVNKKAELWKRRWKRAQMILADDDVVLKSWRVGTDVVDEAVGLVLKAQREDERTDGKEKGGGGGRTGRVT